MLNHKPELSVVILCYRSGEFSSVFYSRMKKVLDDNLIDYEIILVGNYKREMKDDDKTPKVVSEIATKDKKVKAVVKEKMGMMGWDMRSGLDEATGQAVAVIDGDGQMPPEDVIKVFKALKTGNHDIAKTYRDNRFDGFYRIAISKVYNSFLKVLFPRVKVKDVNSKPKILKREALNRLRLSSDDWFIDAEIIIKGAYLGFSIVETPTEFHPNDQRPSFINSRAILEFIKNLFIYRIKLFKKELI